MRDETLHTPVDGVGRRSKADGRKAPRLVAGYEGVERSSMPPPGGWRRGWKIAFILLAALASWAVVIGLLALIL